MEEDLLEKLSSFVLTNNEEEAVVLDDEDFNISRQECLRSAMGKVITQKGVNLGGLKASMDLAWGYPKGLKVMEVGGGIYQFIFGKESDLLRVISGGPWLYNNHLIVLHRWEEGVKPEQINFSYSSFWIQLRALPLEFMSVEVGKKMMVGFGEVLEVMLGQLHGNQGRCIRVKVELDITKPIPRGKRVCTAEWKPIWVPFRYEKFPLLCHYCGIVGHDDKACLLKYNEAKAGILKENQYGVWLRASPVKGSAKKRSDGRSEASAAESSMAAMGQKETENSARDMHDPAKSGSFGFGRRRIQWDSYNAPVAEVGVGHLGPPLLGPTNSGYIKPGIIPEDIMEEDPTMNNSGKSKAKKEIASEQGKETLTTSQNIEHGKALERVHELIVKERLVTDSTQNLGARRYKKKLGGGSRRGVGKVHTNNAGAAQNKRKFEVGLVEVEIEEVSIQSPNKKQKVTDQGGVNYVAEKVEVASQKWAHSMDNVLVVEPSGIAGGLAVLWKRGLNVSLVRRSSFFIEVLIKDDETNHEWHLINLYASSIDRVRNSQWEELLRYRQRSTGDWVLWGDFNDILWEDEKQGGRRREVWSLRSFRDFVSSLGVLDLGFQGYPFTWSNRRGRNGHIKERLDRVLVSPGWRSCYDRARVQHLFAVGSDHAALLLDTNPPRFTGHRQFRFDNRWTYDPESHETVRKCWQRLVQGSKMFTVFNKVRDTRRELRVWSKTKGFNARKKINDIQDKLKAISEGQDTSDVGLIRGMEKELGDAWLQEERFWRQKARKSWMAEGDRNTAFFHAKVTQRRRRNFISGVQDPNGNWREGQDAIANEFVNYFQSLFQTEGANPNNEVVESIQARVTDQMNTSLTRQFSPLEIRQALFDIDPSKAPGADGMTAGFYQKYWETVGDDVTLAVQSFFQSGHLLKSLNHTQIVLIPKVKTPMQVSQFRPISLCNVFYKIIAKAFANRLRSILPALISKNQSAFVKNRQITDNILVAHEVVHYLKNRRRGRDGYMALKLDVAKAYDRVEWFYLEAVMKHMGFDIKWLSVPSSACLASPKEVPPCKLLFVFS
ncbi:hypothetical protein RHSIM_Rhsim05G0174100 [Rhododendron simsii]|uniref:Reverse transcriptase domain-containing protein n=1 Tax=Rhododendron simsii TaxID=118357 RepID=A0A834GZ64_RHOSS|nr:hypothetical protein RHSIM_Rhsim05G0174100 [Rhododendron simsii]